jgi:tetratricopeptide (TPR) repeat protein
MRVSVPAGSLLSVVVLSAAVTAQDRPPADAQKSARQPASVSELEAAAKTRPRDPRVHVALGLAYWDRNEFPRALESFERAVKVGPDSAEAHNWLGVALAEKSDLPGAIAQFKKAVSLDPAYGRAYTNLGSTLATSGEFAEAVEVFQKALALEPNSLGAQLNLGMALREKGDLDNALEYLRRAALADPASASIQYELGQTLRQSGDLPAAVTALEKALELDPELREGYYALGMTLKQQSAKARPPASRAPGAGDDSYSRGREAADRGELTTAREQLTEAVRLDDRNADAHNLLGFVLGQLGDLPSALVHLERAVALQPESPAARYNLGVALWYSGSRDRALSELREGARLDPAAGANHAFLGTALRDQGDPGDARVSLQRAIALLPPTAAVYVDLGIVYLRTANLGRALGQLEAGLNVRPPAIPAPDWDAAISGLRQRLTVKPSGSDQGASAAAHNILGRMLGRRGADSKDVTAEFREAVRLRPDFAEAHNNLGLVLLQAGEDEGAIASLREAVRLSPDYADARANLGAALTPTNADAAVAELEKAVALAPTSVKAQFNLAVAYGASPKHGLAKEIVQLRKVIELAPAFGRAHVALGKALLRDGHVPEAVASLQEAARLEPSSGEAHYQLGLALARAGRKEEATAELSKGRELVAADDRNQHASLDIAEGRAAMEKGELEQAAEKFRRAIQRRPDSSEARRYLTEVLEKQGVPSQTSAAERPGAADPVRPAPLAASPAHATAAGASPADDRGRMAEFEGLIRESRFTEVEPLLAAYVKERPTSSWGWYALGYSQFAQQKIGESIKALAKSLELDIANAEAHKILGRNLMIIGRFDAAQVEFEQAIRYKPDSAESYYNLGKLHSIQDNWEPARKAFEAALRIDPSYLEAMDGLGFALEAVGNDSAAIEKYEQAIALNEKQKGTFASAHVNLSAYYNRTGNAEKALGYARQAIELDPKSDRAWFQKAKADEAGGRLEEAVDALNRALVINARASSYYYVLAGIYRRLGWMDESRKALEMFKRLEQEGNELEKKRRGADGREPSGGGTDA